MALLGTDLENEVNLTFHDTTEYRFATVSQLIIRVDVFTGTISELFTA